MMFYKGWEIEYVYSDGTVINPYWKLSKGFQVIWLNGVMSLDDVKNFIDGMFHPKHIGMGRGVDENSTYIDTATGDIGKLWVIE